MINVKNWTHCVEASESTDQDKIQKRGRENRCTLVSRALIVSLIFSQEKWRPPDKGKHYKMSTRKEKWSLAI